MEGTDRVSGQLRGDKECPFSDIPKSGRVWRKVPESDAQSVPQPAPTPSAHEQGMTSLPSQLETPGLSARCTGAGRGSDSWAASGTGVGTGPPL